MSEASPQVLAARQLLEEVCTLLGPYMDDAVLIGGWVPEIRFPNAIPAHVGSVDVDFASRASRARYEEMVALLLKSGFRRSGEAYQFTKNFPVGGRSLPARLDFLASPQHLAANFEGEAQAPFPASGAELVFADNSVEEIGACAVRVASVVPFIVMKAHAMIGRAKAKDAYDLHFCLENYPEGIAGLAEEFTRLVSLASVQEILKKLAKKFRSEDDSGPCDVVEIEGQVGEARQLRKQEVFSRVDDFLRAVGIVE